MKTTRVAATILRQREGGRDIFLSRPIYLTTLGFLLVIYLDEIISVCDDVPAWGFAFSLILHATTAESSDSKYNKDSSYKLLASKSRVLGVLTSSFWGPAQ